MSVTRQAALELLERYTTQQNLFKHALATEAILRALALRLGEDPERWGIAGLLHDIDYDLTKETPEKHTLAAESILREAGVDEDLIQAVKAHNAEALQLVRRPGLDVALTCAEAMTGMVTAAALVHPDKKIRSVKPKSILKRMKEVHFARSVNRGHIRLCEELGIPLADFAQLSLDAMSEVAESLGL